METPTVYISISDGEKNLAIDGHLDLLARAYALILSWSDPPNNAKPADPGTFGEQPGPAGEETENLYQNGKSVTINSTTVKGGDDEIV